MNKNTLKWGLLALALVTVVAGSSSLALASRPAASEVPPERVAESYYAWYLAYPGQPPARNALADGAYRARPELAPEFVQKVDGILASFDDKGGYDPFLCAQDTPRRISLAEVKAAGNSATATMDLTWAGNQMVSHLDVALARGGKGWQIVDVRCGEATPMSPGQVVRAFYDQYLERAGQGSPLGNGAYRDMPFLSPAFAERVDALVASFDKGGYDPFLCAQDVPGEVAVAEAVVSGGEATVAVSSNLIGHSFTVKLALENGQWQIADVACKR